ncbi:Hexapeptide repeat of succinyl-transferase [Tenacibaculum sp. MAR_2009_124]|uniref:DapH/DapD/GlmU-related protein n=1 Tax=Tenacibaculum sp. MAR_2009_124 TaxID=1250059 RepID=UPI00089A4814|nr:DapH/DapD/GlmU-related protein [Tenacibaculum sp. MAR_2009_124]SEB52830.1 Hexapeptide repeat of succinyl-transferase [Tenacibaculum sp. MAR_2009_124]
MIDINKFINSTKLTSLEINNEEPWRIINGLENILLQYIRTLDEDYVIKDNVAIHKTAIVEKGVTFKGIVVISENCFIGAHAYLRGPIFLSDSVTIGPGSEIKQSMIFDRSAVAHFNYIGNSIVGMDVNFEAGSICANHYNERTNKRIFVKYNDKRIDTGMEKFGSLVGDNSKIGANGVLSPGTILERNSIVKRLELVEQISL